MHPRTRLPTRVRYLTLPPLETRNQEGPLYHALFALALLAASAVFALLEIQIEGAAGWARNLPTWRFENRWTRLLLGGRAITGYHTYFHLLILILLHLPYAFAFAAPSLSAELRILAFAALFWVVEDFLWFVFNPAYGVSRFRKQDIPWHAPNWWGFMPRDYWLFGIGGTASYIISWL